MTFWGALHRYLERHGISRLSKDPENASKRKRVAETKIGYVHIDVCELRSAEGKTHMFLAIHQVSKFVYVELHPATMLIGAGAGARVRAGQQKPCRRPLTAGPGANCIWPSMLGAARLS
jgi:hypothetical protein